MFARSSVLPKGVQQPVRLRDDEARRTTEAVMRVDSAFESAKSVWEIVQGEAANAADLSNQ